MSVNLDNNAIGQRIKNIRLSLGETTEVFSQHFNPKASKGTISKWENGMYLPNNKRIKKIAELGNISVNELLYGSKEVYFKNLLKDAVTEGDSSYSENLVNEIVEYLIAYENLDDMIASIIGSGNTDIDISELESNMIENFIDNHINEFVNENNDLDFSDKSAVINSFVNFTSRKKKYDLTTFEGAHKHLLKENEKIDPYFYYNGSIEEFLNDDNRMFRQKDKDELIDLYFRFVLNREVNDTILNIYSDYLNFKSENK